MASPCEKRRRKQVQWKAELERSVAAPDTQIVIMARVEGPPENLADTGGNVMIAFTRRNPIDFQWILPLLKDVKAIELQIPFGNGFRRFQVPARKTDGTWAMVDLFKLDRSALPDGWTPLCEVDPSAYIRESIMTRCM